MSLGALSERRVVDGVLIRKRIVAEFGPTFSPLVLVIPVFPASLLAGLQLGRGRLKFGR